jgi:LuxR family maltose regulon positive regulatory protein
VHLSIARAELLISDGSPDLAAERLERACRTGQGLVDQHLQAMVLLALLQARDGNEKRAADTFCSAVELASPEQFIQPFLQFGRPVEHLFRLVERHRPLTDRAFAKLVLEKAAPLWPAVEGPRLGARTEALEQQPTERELEVLRSLDSLASLSEISASLFVSVNTLKAHLRSLYRKLGVGSRREAVAKARSLGLL